MVEIVIHMYNLLYQIFTSIYPTNKNRVLRNTDIFPEKIANILKNWLRNTKKVRWFPIRLIQTSKFGNCYI
mgnify:CR=1 FL=1